VQDLVERELWAVLAAWKAGQPVRSIVLGHSVVLDPAYDNEPAREFRRPFRQVNALAYALDLVERYLQQKPDSRCLIDRNDFEFLCQQIPLQELSRGEREAGESLAWKALLCGWERALAGFEGHHYLALVNPLVGKGSAA
jgi:hypothetical protein